ncbi:MAG: oligosaccharide flippase family protein [Elusimicrobia bacterium]|nr:oligosaccharide flippase family protein [Elusimicrobiota bacterium]
MLRDIRTLGQETLVYGLSTVVARLLNFLLLPFYTHYLTTSEYGVVATVFAYVAFFNVLYQYGMDQAYMRFASEEGRSAEDAFSTAMWSLAATSIAFSLALHLLAEPLASLGGVPGRADLVRYAAWILAFDALSTVPFADLRLQHRAWLFAGVKTFNIALNLAMNICLIAGLGLGVRGVFLASLTASAATLAVLAPVISLKMRPLFLKDLYKELLRFGWPLVPAGLGSMAVQVIDRPILLRLADESTVGIYQASYRLGIFMQLIVNMFDQAWRPFFLQKAKDPDSGAIFGRILTYYAACGFWIVLILSLFIPDIARLSIGGRAIIHESYWPGLSIVPIVLAAYLLNGIYDNFMASVTLSKRTDVLPWVTLLGAAVKILGTFALVPYWRMMGAAWATFLAYGAMAAALGIIGRRVYPIPYERGRLAHVALAAAATTAFAYAASLCSSAILWTGARLAAVLAFPALLYWTHFLSEDERRLLDRVRSGQ